MNMHKFYAENHCSLIHLWMAETATHCLALVTFKRSPSFSAPSISLFLPFWLVSSSPPSVHSCFLSLLLVAAVVWKIKQSCWASRRREVSQRLKLTTCIDLGYSGRKITKAQLVFISILRAITLLEILRYSEVPWVNGSYDIATFSLC